MAQPLRSLPPQIKNAPLVVPTRRVKFVRVEVIKASLLRPPRWLFGPRIFSVAVILGAVAVERHITLDRSMYGSDQAASLEPSENSAGPTCVWVALMVSKRAVAQSLKTIASRLTPFPIARLPSGLSCP